MTGTTPARQRGRPKGSAIPLDRDKRRFELAAWLALTGAPNTQMARYPGAYLAIGLFATAAPVRATSLDGILTRLSTTAPSSVVKRAERMQAKAQRALGEASAKDQAWLEQSAGYLAGLVALASSGNDRGVDFVLDRLVELGWGEPLRVLHDRLSPALASNAPPAEGKLSPLTRRLLAQTKRALNDDPAPEEITGSNYFGDGVQTAPVGPFEPMEDPMLIAQPIAMTLEEASTAARTSRSALYAAIASGDLMARKNGSRTVVLRSDLEAFLRRLPAAQVGRRSGS
ncbi:helix-turn-helix domain-containing protein [Salinarimonas soli]|nr:helix-turn-helix domain-containing protein [Salinarimonas soli]